MTETTLDEYCRLENLFDDFNNKYLNEDENFISQNITAGLIVIWIHFFLEFKRTYFGMFRLFEQVTA